ncbi:MAG: hypothetical protein ACOC1P_03940, partial [Minisyncoccales bacterium]
GEIVKVKKSPCVGSEGVRRKTRYGEILEEPNKVEYFTSNGTSLPNEFLSVPVFYVDGGDSRIERVPINNVRKLGFLERKIKRNKIPNNNIGKTF